MKNWSWVREDYLGTQLGSSESVEVPADEVTIRQDCLRTDAGGGRGETGVDCGDPV